MNSTPCPPMQDLQRFFLGQDDDTAARQIEHHLSDCPHCVATLDHLDVSDELVEAAHAHGRQSNRLLQTDRVDGLIERLKGLNSPTLSVTASQPDTALLAPAQAPDEIGRLGGYRIRRELGSGGMGIVYLAEDTRLQRPVALKVLRAALATSVSVRQRFLREARAIATIVSDFIVPIYEVNEDRGLPFLAMPVLRGETLATRLARQGRLPADEVRRIGRQAAQGLEAAHRHGLVHRDVKPANIWLEATPDGGERVKLLDFGLVQVANERGNLTELGTIVGTPEFMAPEQARGEPVDARCDLFSLGSILYAMAAGRPPFHGSNSLAVLRSVCDDTPPPLGELAPDLPEDLIELIQKLHAKDPGQRCPSAQEVINCLERRPNRTVSRSRRSLAKRWAHASALLVAIGGLTILAAQFITRAQHVAEMFTQSPEDPGIEDENPQTVAAADDEPAQPPQGLASAPLAILPFEERGSGVKELGGQVADLLFAKLSTKDDLVLVDRADLARTLKELELGLSGAVSKESAPRVGQLTGARLFLSGTVLQADKRRHLVAKLISVETGRIVGLSVDDPQSGELSALVTKLSEKVTEKLDHLPTGFLPRPEKKEDRMAALKRQLGNQKLPSLWINIKESSAARPAPDPAAQTEVVHLARTVGFQVVDAEEGAKGQAQILITGEGLSEVGSRNGGLVTVKARLEVKAVDRATGKVIAMERQTALVVDSTEQLAGKAALQQAAEAIAHRLLPKVVKR